MSAGPARPRREWRSVDGILLLDKPVGLSSNQALQRARRLYRAAKAGHTGSLDPLASGVLPLCFGEATKVAGLLLDSDKSYRAVLALGSRTATGDAEGAVIEERAVPPLADEAVARVLAGFLGEQQQVPPMYSALKRDGEALYALARRGIEVERAPRRVLITALRLENLDARAVTFSVSCSKGTYIRTLGEDIAVALGTVGHLAALRRTEVRAFAGLAAHDFEALERVANAAALDALLLPVDAALSSYPAVHLSAAEAARFRQGQGADLSPAVPADCGAGVHVRVYEEPARFLGLGITGATPASVRAVRLMSRGG